MKYKAIHASHGVEQMAFILGCSECETKVDHDDKFCRKCGRKLEPIPNMVHVDDVCAAVTKAARNGEFKGRRVGNQQPVALGEAPRR